MTSLAVHAQQPLEGVPLVLLHAFPLDSTMWDPVIERLPAIPVVTIDAPGFGGSSPAEEPGLEAYAGDVVAAIRELGVDEAVVVGLSMGGYVAMAIAQDAPGLLAGIGLISTKASADTEVARADRLAMAAAAEAGDPDAAAPMLDRLLGQTTRDSRPELVAAIRGKVQEAPSAGVAWAQRSMAARPDRLAALAALPDGLPALVMRGGEDGAMSDGDAAAMAEVLAVEVVGVPDVGHLTAIEAPDAVAEALADLYANATA